MTENEQRTSHQENAEDLFPDYTGICCNCHAPLNELDKYCRRCGTRRGESRFDPYQNISPCLYGPPPADRTEDRRLLARIQRTVRRAISALTGSKEQS